MSKSTILREKAYIPSVSEYGTVHEKFLAFMGAKLSQRAKDEGAYESDDYGTGWYTLRSDVSNSLDKVYCGYCDGKRDWSYSSDKDAGLRVAFNLIYNPECDLVKTSRMKKRAGSTAPIITLKNGTKCIWLNKEECKAAYARGETALMNLWTLDLVACAEPFAENGDHNDYAKAVKLRKQCENWLESNLSEEEMAMVIEVEMSSEDFYETATPILENQDATTKTNTSNEDENE